MTANLPPLPEPELLGAEVVGHVAEFYGYSYKAVRALQLSTWNAAMEEAAKACKQIEKRLTEEGRPSFVAARECAAAIRSMKDKP